MAKESLKAKRERAAKVEEEMFSLYGEGSCSLDYSSPFTLTVAVVLSAQCSDAAVNKVTPPLFKSYGTPAEMGSAQREDIENIIHPLGFFKTKAKNLIALARMVEAEFEGEIPSNIKDLQKLPGVGRKTANVVMCEAFHVAQGIAVDTHVFRIAHRLRFASKSDNTPNKTEKQLLKIIPQQDLLYINHQWVSFGRQYCKAQNPRCTTCPIGDLCPSKSIKKAFKERD